MSEIDVLSVYKKLLGLTSHEAMMYEALLAVGPEPADDLAIGLDIRVHAVYRLANNLAKKGFVVIHPGWPRYFEAVPLRTVVDHAVRTFDSDAA